MVSELRWPGVDKFRALQAAHHYEGAARGLGLALRADSHGKRRALLETAAAYIVQGRGYLGAIGFERGRRDEWNRQLRAS